MVERSRAAGMVPIVTLCYTRNDFTAVEYGYTRRMNAAINRWDVPSVNLLGAVDDGTGKWVSRVLVGQPASERVGPRRTGHHVRALAVRRAGARQADAACATTGAGYARLSPAAALTFTPDATMHPFALGLSVRVTGDGPAATISGTALDAATSTKTVTRAGQAPLTIASTSLTPGGGGRRDDRRPQRRVDLHLHAPAR